MKRLMKTCLLGALLSFAACATSATSTTTPAPDPQTSQSTASDPQDLDSARLAGALLATEPDDAESSLVNSCVSQCDGDEGCIICCHCKRPTFCCM